MKPLIVVLALALATGIALTAAGVIYPNCIDRYIMDRILKTRSTAYEHAMHKLSELWSNDNYLDAAASITAHGDDRAYAWLESSAKAMALSEAFVSSLKYVVGRRRPDGELNRKNASFPSSHASSAFAFAATLAKHYPERGAEVFEIAFYVGLSRVYLERHYPSDVAGGAAIGLAAAMASETYLSWLKFDRRTVLDILLFVSASGMPEEIETPLFQTGGSGE
jgi:undecaprenyl-diphosphatase